MSDEQCRNAELAAQYVKELDDPKAPAAGTGAGACTEGSAGAGCGAGQAGSIAAGNAGCGLRAARARCIGTPFSTAVCISRWMPVT